MKTILPYSENPIYDTYNVQRNLHAILQTMGEDCEAWLYNAFIQVFSAKDLYAPMMYNYNTGISHFQNSVYQECPLLECFRVTNIAKNDIGVSLRILSMTKPDDHAVNVSPSLEDYYLTVFSDAQNVISI